MQKKIYLKNLWKLVQIGTVPKSELGFQDYEFTNNGRFITEAFMSYQVKIVMTSTNTSTPPLFRDLRVIATA